MNLKNMKRIILKAILKEEMDKTDKLLRETYCKEVNKLSDHTTPKKSGNKLTDHTAKLCGEDE